MSLFPAYASSNAATNDTNNQLQSLNAAAIYESALDWLKSDSYSVGVKQLSSDIINVSSTSDEEEDFIDLDAHSSKDSAVDEDIITKNVAISLRRDEEAVKLRSLPSSSHSKIPLGALFLEDLTVASIANKDQRPLAYRIDRERNSSLIKYGSIFEGHLSRYFCPFLSAICGKKRNVNGFVMWKKGLVKKTTNANSSLGVWRYYGRPTLKRLQKYVKQPVLMHQSPLSVKDLPLVIKLSSKSTTVGVDKSTVASSSKSETPYDELKKAAIRQRTEEFNRRLNLESGNIQLWLDFIDFQNDVARFGETTMTETALLEKKLAIIDRAISNNPGNVQLFIEKIKLKGTTATNQDAIAEEWRNIAFVHPSNADVWWECIMATSRRFTSFSIDKLLLNFSKCLSTLSDINDGTILSHKPAPNMEEQMIYIFIALAYLLREAGFTERAIVLLQCQIEFSILQPARIASLPRLKAVDEMELYFSAGLPLFGQAGACGWNKWQPSTISTDKTSAGIEEEDEMDKLIVTNAPEGSTLSDLWSYLEESRTARRVLPFPASTAMTDDPERQVLFDDVSRFLVKVKAPENKYRLLLLFLEFFGVDIVSCGTIDSFIKPDAFSISFSARTFASSMFHPLGRTGPVSRPKLVRYDASTFRDIINFAYIQAVAFLEEPFKTHFIAVYVRQELASYLAALESSHDDKSLEKRARQVKQIIREILREPANRNNLAIWALCSELEMLMSSKISEAVRIAETAIGVSHNLKLYTSWGALCHLATQTAFFTFGFVPDMEVMDITRLCVNVDDQPSSTTCHIARVLASCLLRRAVPETADVISLRDEVISQVIPYLKIAELAESSIVEEQLMPVQPLVCQLGSCFALFLYVIDMFLKNDLALASADKVFTDLLNGVDAVAKKRSLNPMSSQRRFLDQVITRLHFSRINLALFDYRTNIKPVTSLRDVVLCALNDLPNNRFFLRCLATLKEATFLSSTFLKFIRSMSHRINLPQAWLQIFYDLLTKVETSEIELCNSASSGGINLIRSFFEKSVTVNPLTMRSSTVWALYIAFERNQVHASNVTTSRKLESVLFRALQACPWSKEIYISMARGQPDPKLQDAIDMIVEKGLRLCTLVDEVDAFNVKSASKT